MFLLSCCCEDVCLCFCKGRFTNLRMSEDNAHKIEEGDIERVRDMLGGGSDPNCRGRVSFPFLSSFSSCLFACLLD